MWMSGDDFRLVFWIALLPAYLSIALLLVAVKEINHHDGLRPLPMRRSDLGALPAEFWWTVMLASILSLARCSQAFLLLKAYGTGVDAAFVPMILVVMHLVFSLTAYPLGILADRIDRRRQLVIGTIILIGADVVLASASTVWLTALGAALWGLQLGATQGLFGAAIADASPERLRGTAFGIYDIAIGVATFLASAGAGALWMNRRPPATVFGVGGACIASAAALMLLCEPFPKTTITSS